MGDVVELLGTVVAHPYQVRAGAISGIDFARNNVEPFGRGVLYYSAGTAREGAQHEHRNSNRQQQQQQEATHGESLANHGGHRNHAARLRV